MKRIRYCLTVLSACLLALAAGPAAHAQVKDVSIFLQNGNTLLKSLSDHIVETCLILVGLAGMVMAVPNLIKYIKGDPTSNEAFLKLGGGLFLAAVIIQLCRMLIA